MRRAPEWGTALVCGIAYAAAILVLAWSRSLASSYLLAARRPGRAVASPHALRKACIIA